LDGANLHVSMIGFDRGTDQSRTLDGELVPQIHSNLTSAANTPSAMTLQENAGICFIGTQKGGDFDLPPELAKSMLTAPLNVNGLSNTEVIKPWVNGSDITGRSRGMFVVDFGVSMPETEASFYEMPFEYVKAKVRPHRIQVRRTNHARLWWIHAESRPGMRNALGGKLRYIATPRVAKHRLFVWLDVSVLPDCQLFAFARDDDYFFGVLHSRLHEVWSLAMGTALEDRPRYTPTSTFETFPFPWAPGKEAQDNPLVQAIAQAASELVTKRDAWLNPPDAKPETLRKRTLTNLYNERPSWLVDAHRTLDEAVFAAYGWPTILTDAEVLERLLALNHQRASEESKATNAARTKPQ
jgi:hypothetical protein